MSVLKIALLGPPEVEHGDHRLTFRRGTTPSASSRGSRPWLAIPSAVCLTLDSWVVTIVAPVFRRLFW